MVQHLMKPRLYPSLIGMDEREFLQVVPQHVLGASECPRLCLDLLGRQIESLVFVLIGNAGKSFETVEDVKPTIESMIAKNGRNHICGMSPPAATFHHVSL